MDILAIPVNDAFAHMDGLIYPDVDGLMPFKCAATSSAS
jgi:hypothetical protein